MAIDQKAIEEQYPRHPHRSGRRSGPGGAPGYSGAHARMFLEMFEGMNYTNDEIAQMFNRTFEEDFDPVESGSDMVVVRDIDIFSHCEHHLALMYDMKVTVAYIPVGKSHRPEQDRRIADMVSKRLQLQERIGADIAEIIQKVTGSADVAVLISGKHSCINARGIKKTGHENSYLHARRGRFRIDPLLAARVERYSE